MEPYDGMTETHLRDVIDGLRIQLTECERSRQVYSGDAARAEAKLGVVEDDLEDVKGCLRLIKKMAEHNIGECDETI